MTGAKLTPQEIGMLRKSMYGTRDTASNWEGDWQNHMQNRGTSWRQIPQHVNHDEGNISSGMSHGGANVITGPTSRMVELKNRRPKYAPSTKQIIGHGSSKQASRHRVDKCNGRSTCCINMIPSTLTC